MMLTWKENVDEKCRLLLQDKKKKNTKCPEYKGVDFVLASLKQKSHDGVHDIEDLVKIGNDVRGCPYFASWRMLEVAQLVFCPYSYIIDPVIRGGVHLRGSIIIFDESHNMEDIAREAGSINLEEATLFKLRNELELMSVKDPETYQPLCEIVEGLISWIGRKKDSLAKRYPEHFFSSWTGDKALRELKESNITRGCLECLDKAITRSEETEIELDMPYLSGISISTLKELFTTLTYFFSRNGSHILDYELGLQRSIKRGDSSGKWMHIFSLWCMSPAVVFKDLADLSLSIILTSGPIYERYRQPRNRMSISKWLRQSIKLYDNFEESIEGLRSFFNSVKERVDSKMLESQENQSKECKRKESSHVEPKDMAGRKVVDYTSPNPKNYYTNESKAFLDHKDRKPKIAEGSRSMRLSGVNSGASISQLSSPFIQVKEESKCYKEVIDLECGVNDFGK